MRLITPEETNTMSHVAATAATPMTNKIAPTVSTSQSSVFGPVTHTKLRKWSNGQTPVVKLKNPWMGRQKPTAVSRVKRHRPAAAIRSATAI